MMELLTYADPFSQPQSGTALDKDPVELSHMVAAVTLLVLISVGHLKKF